MGKKLVGKMSRNIFRIQFLLFIAIGWKETMFLWVGGAIK